MPHHDDVHSLQIALATALRERDTEREFRGAAEAAFAEQLARTEAAESERDAFRAEVKRLREALGGLNPLPAHVLNEACEGRQSVDYARVVKWMQEQARAALASPAAGEEG